MPDDRTVDAELVAALIAQQFPEWRGLPVVQVLQGGWDNRTFRLGDELMVRLPSAAAYVQVEKRALAAAPRRAAPRADAGTRGVRRLAGALHAPPVGAPVAPRPTASSRPSSATSSWRCSRSTRRAAQRTATTTPSAGASPIVYDEETLRALDVLGDTVRVRDGQMP